MAKMRISKEEADRGWAFDLKRIQVDLFHLLCFFLAEEKYASTINGDDDPLWRLASFGEPEMTRILVSSAVIGRVIDDREDRFLPTSSSHCGTLDMNGRSAGLTLREAFNKIIHAESFDLEISDNEEPITPLEPRVFLHGKLGPDVWEAQLDIVAYVREYCRHFDGLAKDEPFT